MTKARVLFLIVLCAAWPQRAFAQYDWIDWAQPGSGPGPYRSSVGFFTRVFCVKEAPVPAGGSTQNGPTRSGRTQDGPKRDVERRDGVNRDRPNQDATSPEAEPEVEHRVTSCFDDTDPKIKIVVDVHYGHITSQNVRFNDPVAVAEPLNSSSITIDHFDLSYSYRLSPLLDVGIAIGSYTYSGEGFSTTSRLTLTPIHVSFVPLGYWRGKMGKRWGRVVRVNYWNRRLVGDTVAADFGSKGSYVVRGEFSQGIAISADFWSFISYGITRRN